MSASSNGITLLFYPGATSQRIILCCCGLRVLSYILLREAAESWYESRSLHSAQRCNSCGRLTCCLQPHLPERGDDSETLDFMYGLKRLITAHGDTATSRVSWNMNSTSNTSTLKETEYLSCHKFTLQAKREKISSWPTILAIVE